VLARMLAAPKPGDKSCAMAFGPGLTAETMTFGTVAGSVMNFVYLAPVHAVSDTQASKRSANIMAN
jgi:hypothetical protein